MKNPDKLLKSKIRLEILRFDIQKHNHPCLENGYINADKCLPIHSPFSGVNAAYRFAI